MRGKVSVDWAKNVNGLPFIKWRDVMLSSIMYVLTTMCCKLLYRVWLER